MPSTYNINLDDLSNLINNSNTIDRDNGDNGDDVDDGVDEDVDVDDSSDYIDIITTTHTIYKPTGSRVIYLTKNGAFVKFDTLDNFDKIKKIENYFTLKYKTFDGKMRRIKSIKMDKKNNRMILPRFGSFEVLTDKFGLSDCTIKSQLKPGDDISVEWKGKQNNNQKIITDYILSNYYTKERVKYGSAGLILNLMAGQGKSYVAAYLIYKLQKKTAIILHSTSIMKQWYKVLINCFGDDVSIGYYYASKKKDGDIVLMIIDSATRDEFSFKNGKETKTLKAIDYYNQFGFVVYDECHTYANKFSLKALKNAQTPYMLGLSATPDENPMGFDKLVWWEIGPVLEAETIDGYEKQSENFKGIVHRVKYYGPEEFTKNIINPLTETMNVAGTISMLCLDEYRSMMIIQCIMDGLKLKLNMFVFADRREYLEHLRQLLQNRHKITSEIVVDEKDFVRVVGGADDDALEHAELNSRVIFTTYQYMGTGKSVTKMTGLVLATPRKSKMKQYIGRIFRLGSDMTITRHIWDVCDMKTKLTNQYNTRKKYYAEKDYEILEEKVKYIDVDCFVPDMADDTTINTGNKTKVPSDKSGKGDKNDKSKISKSEISKKQSETVSNILAKLKLSTKPS